MIEYIIVKKGTYLRIDVTNFSKRKLKNLILRDVKSTNKKEKGYYKNPKIPIQKAYKNFRNRQNFGK